MITRLMQIRPKTKSKAQVLVPKKKKQHGRRLMKISSETKSKVKILVRDKGAIQILVRKKG